MKRESVKESVKESGERKWERMELKSGGYYMTTWS
jgi:hypothetical protein